MRKILLIIRREYIARVKTRAFLIGTIASPVLLVSLVLLPAFFAGRGIAERKVTVLDQSGDGALFEAIRARAASPDGTGGTQGQRRTNLVLSHRVVGPEEDIDEVRREYSREVEQNSLTDYVVLRKGVLDGIEPEYYSRNVNVFAARQLELVISAAVIKRRLVRVGFDSEQVSGYLQPIDLKTIKVASEGESEQSGTQLFQVAFIMLFFIYVTVLIYGISVMRGVIEEKQSRIVEVLVSSVKPVQVMVGKLVGIGLVGLTQYILWVVLALVLSSLGANLMSSYGVSFPKLPVVLLVYFVVFFLLGYFLYATLYAMVGAIVSSEEEGQHIQFPITLLIVLPMVLFAVVLQNPNGGTSVALSMVPFFTPTIMMLRIAVGPPPALQIILSIVVMIGTILGATWVAARIYRVGILMYGKRPSIAEVGRWLRYS